jgi:hypothetical protein
MRYRFFVAVAVADMCPIPEAFLVAAVVTTVTDYDVGIEIQEGFPFPAAGTGENEMIPRRFGMQLGEEFRAIETSVNVFEKRFHVSSKSLAV